MDLYENGENEEIGGLIEKIHVKNFLCHDNLRIDFTSNNINWVVGRNGSGKSAIITALIVGLGGRAAATSRGSNFQSFIKRGTNSATVEIRIKNSGRNAYQPTEYGDHITIIRTITLGGGSSYMVKSATGEIKSKKFQDVKAITLALEIQVDNPISVLNQDDARSFCRIDPERMYSLFRRATNLDHSQTNYQKVKDNCKKAMEIKNDKEKTLAHLKKEYQEWESKDRRLASRNQLRQQIRALENEIAWSDIHALKRERDHIKQELDSLNSKCQKITEKIRSLNEDFGNKRSCIEGLMKQLKECQTKRMAFEQEKKNIEQKLRYEEEDLRSAQNTTATKRNKLNKEMKKVADFEREIRNIESGGSERRRDELERRVCEAREALAALEARASTAEHALQQARAQHELALANDHRHRDRERDAKDQLDKLRKKQDELKLQRGDPLAMFFGGEMVELRRRIDQAVKRREFSKPPIGPVGHYVRLKDPKWSKALEHIIGNMKKTFCVNSPADTRRLFEIMQEVWGSKPKPSVTCSAFQPARYDVSSRRVRRLCALDVLDVSDAVVANFLIDNLALERVVLVPDQETAIQLSDTEENVPENCLKIVTQDCTEFYPAPNYRSYGAGERREHGYLLARSEELEARRREEVAAAEAQWQQVSQQAQAARHSAQRTGRALGEAQAQLAALQEARTDADHRLRAAQRDLDSHRSPQSDELEKELNISKKNVETLQVEVGEATELENRLTQKIEEYRNSISRIKTQLIEITENERTIRGKVEQEESNVENEATKRQNYERILKENEKSAAEKQNELAQKEAVITEKAQRALQKGDSIETPRERRALEEQLAATRAELRQVDGLQLDPDVVRGELGRAREEYTQLRDLLERFGALVEEIQTCIENRLKFCYKLEIQITRRVQFRFFSNLATHGYNGRIVVRHSEGRLELELSARDNSDNSVRPAAALSGGERSYCTVALLLALWECVELPFYFLDEFDVFLDDMNRQIVVELLLDFARRRSARQFVLLAPHAPHASALPPPARLQVHRLDDPRP